MSTKTKPAKTPLSEVDSIRHKDKRANIPTEELRDFVADDEKSPKKLLYPRDPSLDPQLVWKGKDEQDRQDLAVPVVPVYIQEKIQPLALIENLRAKRAQAELFADFNGIEFEQYIDFYHHGQSWTNRMILGDSLLVMASLAEKEGLKGKVQMIYMDPPYGIKFGSNWQVSTRKRDLKDGKAEDLTRQPEQIRAFRDTWELGIHSYLAYLRDRLAGAQDLLTDSGSVFVQIGDDNLHLVRCLLDEVFGSGNEISLITIVKTSAQEDLLLPAVCDYVLWYAKDKSTAKFRQFWLPKTDRDAGAADYNRIQTGDGTRRGMTSEEESNWAVLPGDARPYTRDNIVSERPPGDFPVTFEGQPFRPISGYWKTGVTGMQKLLAANRIERRGRMLRYVRFFDDFGVRPLANYWPDARFSSRAEDKAYVVQTAARVIERCLLMATDPGDLVIDPTCGSGTTAYVAERWGRRWITIDTSRVALALARTRLMAAKYPYYLLADSSEGIAKEAELTGVFPNSSAPPQGDVKRGFVYKRVPHVTLKSIANNEEIDVIHARHQEQLEPLREKLNAAFKQNWEEWEIPREADAKWPAFARKTYEEWWNLRRARQQEIDASIARRADTEYLYDQPHEDGKRVRVSGPFTVESLSPHRVLAPADEERPATERDGEAADTVGDFVTVILDNLRKAGIKGTDKSQAIRFDRLESFAGEHIHATGEYYAAGKPQRVAIAIGPQYGTVGPEHIKEAAKEAVRGIGFDLLVVCGFAFDPHVSEEVRRYGKLSVQVVRMNPDLLMGEELLKKTGAGNLFTVFGEPDVDIRRRFDGKLEVEIRGLDVYDPTTQEIRSHSTEDIACWFIDTEYNGESFFVRHAYFTGTDKPYEKLKRAMRAEVDEAAWSSLYSTTSRPFDRPKTGKIAVKVINHYGDEVLKVFVV
jgi:adenine-specific DNA-methyltransferase